VSTDAAPVDAEDVPLKEPNAAKDRQPDQSLDQPDAVEAALANALQAATAAGRWDVVGELARQLDARRAAAAAPNVIPIKRRRS
jgi:hypothetical protein